MTPQSGAGKLCCITWWERTADLCRSRLAACIIVVALVLITSTAFTMPAGGLRHSPLCSTSCRMRRGDLSSASHFTRPTEERPSRRMRQRRASVQGEPARVRRRKRASSTRGAMHVPIVCRSTYAHRHQRASLPTVGSPISRASVSTSRCCASISDGQPAVKQNALDDLSGDNVGPWESLVLIGSFR